MTSRERVKRALEFKEPDRVPRDLWVLPMAEKKYKTEIEKIKRRFPLDIVGPEYNPPLKDFTRGEKHGVGIYVDEWGCVFKNLQRGIMGEVKEPLVKDYRDIDKVKPPWKLLGKGMEKVNESCRRSEKFTLGPGVTLFERMQFLRGTENLLVDLMEEPPGLFELRDIVHEYNLKHFKIWVQTEVDGLSFADDWGSQNALLIPPRVWRKIFKPLYREYIEIVHKAGKYFFFHSDGYIMEIVEDLIEIGVDALNSQIFCMDMEELGRRFKGRITFWGEIDRQWILTANNPASVKEAVRKVKKALWDKKGGVIAQCEFGAGAKPENVRVVFEEWEKLAL